MADSEDDDYKVGYGKPPKEHQFKKGHSGNPGGRKPGSQNMRSIIKKNICRSVTIKIDGRRANVSAKEAVFLGLQNDAMKRIASARRQYFELIEKFAPEELETAVEEMRLSSDNREILKRYLERHMKKGGSDCGPETDA